MLLLVFVTVSLFFYYIWQRRHLLRLAAKIKGPTGFPIVGSAYRFLNADRILDVINDFSKTYGGPGKFWLGNRLFVYINDPKHFDIILNTPASLNKGDSYNFISESIGLGLITLKSDEWRFHRKNLNPSFHYNVVKSFYPTFNKNLKILTKKLTTYADKGTFNLQWPLQSCAMDMICGNFPTMMDHSIKMRETTLGLNIKSQNDENSIFLHNAHAILDITARRFFQPWIQPQLLFRLSKLAKSYYHSVNYLNNFISDLFKLKKAEFLDSMSKSNSIPMDSNNNELDDEKPAEKTIFIDRIVKLAVEDRVFTEQNVLDELKTVLLAKNKSLHRCVALRFFPVVPFLTRILKEDMCLGEVTIPKGAEYIMDIWNMHRIQSNWKFDATKFNPENFFPQNAIARHPYSYVPFSAGPRSCIGIKYGNIALKLIIVYIVRQFRISTKARLEDLQFRMRVTLSLINDDIFEFECRNVC